MCGFAKNAFIASYKESRGCIEIYADSRKMPLPELNICPLNQLCKIQYSIRRGCVIYVLAILLLPFVFDDVKTRF